MDLVDTDVLIDVQRGHSPALAWFSSLTDLPGVPGFVVMELMQDAHNARQVRQALKLVAPMQVVWPTEAECARALSDFTATTCHIAWGYWMHLLPHVQLAGQRCYSHSTTSIIESCPA
jgi:predicted nucleic acid-binding protein